MLIKKNSEIKESRKRADLSLVLVSNESKSIERQNWLKH